MIWGGSQNNTIKIDVEEEIGLCLRNFINYTTPNSEHNWEDMCTQLRKQQTRIFNNHNEIMEGPIPNQIVIDHRFAIGTQVSLCRPNW